MSLVQVAERLEALTKSRPRKALVFALVLAAMIALLRLFADSFLSDHILRPLGTVLTALAEVPMGSGGLAVVAFLVLIIALCAIDTSPNAAVLGQHLTAWKSSRQPRAKPLTVEEKDAVARLRTLWYHDGGQKSSFLMKYLLGMCEEWLKGRYYAPLFADLAKSLDSSDTAFRSALEFERSAPLADVAVAFERWFQAYLKCAETVYDAHQQKDVDLGASEILKQFRQLREEYKTFSEAVVHANNYQGLNRHLRIFAMPGVALSSRKFLGEQPWDGLSPLEEPSSFTPSAQNTEGRPSVTSPRL